MRYILSFLIGSVMALASHALEKQLIIHQYPSLKLRAWHVMREAILWGCLFTLASWRRPLSGQLLLLMINMSFWLFLTLFDYKYMLLPTKVIYVGLGINIALSLFMSYRNGDTYGLMSQCLGALVGYGLFCLIFYGSKWLLKKEGLGYGDVRLMAMIGWCVGIEQLFFAIILASVLAVLVGGLLYMMRRSSEAFPFGPFLCGGAALMSLYGTALMRIYWCWIGL